MHYTAATILDRDNFFHLAPRLNTGKTTTQTNTVQPWWRAPPSNTKHLTPSLKAPNQRIPPIPKSKSTSKARPSAWRPVAPMLAAPEARVRGGVTDPDVSCSLDQYSGLPSLPQSRRPQLTVDVHAAEKGGVARDAASDRGVVGGRNVGKDQEHEEECQKDG